MRTKTVPAKSAEQARKLALWAASFCKCRGYMAFETLQDCATWRNQR